MNPINVDLKFSAQPQALALMAAGVFVAARAGAKLALRGSPRPMGGYNRPRGRRNGILSQALGAVVEKRLERELDESSFRFRRLSSHRGSLPYGPPVVNNYYNSAGADVETSEEPDEELSDESLEE